MGASQGTALAEDSTQRNDSAKQAAPSSAEETTISKQRAATELLKRRKSLIDEAVNADEEIFNALASLKKMTRVLLLNP